MKLTLVFQRGNYHIINAPKGFTISQNKDMFVGKSYYENFVNLGHVIEVHWTPLTISIPEGATFIEAAKTYLFEMLKTTVWGKVERVKERVDALFKLHEAWATTAENSYTPEKAAQSLYEYEIHTLNKKSHLV